MEGSFIGCRQKSTTFLAAPTAASVTEKVISDFLQCEWLPALGKTCWLCVVVECEGKRIPSMQISWELTVWLKQTLLSDGERDSSFLKPGHLGQDRKKLSCMMYEPTGSTRKESNSKLPIQLPRVELAWPCLSAKSQQRVKLMSKLVASFGRSSPILFSVIAVTINSFQLTKILVHHTKKWFIKFSACHKIRKKKIHRQWLMKRFKSDTGFSSSANMLNSLYLKCDSWANLHCSLWA